MATTKKAAKKAPAKKARAKKASPKKAPARKASSKKAPAKKASAKKAPAKRAPAKKAPARKTSTARSATPKVSPVRGKTMGWYVERLQGAQRAVAEQLAQVIARVAPAAVATIKWGQPVWEHGGPFAWMRGAKGHLSVGFWRGAELDDPEALLEGSGGRMRHLKLLPGARVPVEALERWVRQAVDLNASKGSPATRKKA